MKLANKNMKLSIALWVVEEWVMASFYKFVFQSQFGEHPVCVSNLFWVAADYIIGFLLSLVNKVLSSSIHWLHDSTSIIGHIGSLLIVLS